VQSGRDIHVGHKVNAGGVLAVGGILVARCTGRSVPPGVRSTAPDAGIANLAVPRLREDGAKVGANQPVDAIHYACRPRPLRIGDAYVATVTGLAPGERVFLYSTSRSLGTITVLTGDSEGRARAFAREGTEPGNYLIKTDAERSGQTAETPLRVTSGG
jgi:hypothetical protein